MKLLFLILLIANTLLSVINFTVYFTMAGLPINLIAGILSCFAAMLMAYKISDID